LSTDHPHIGVKLTVDELLAMRQQAANLDLSSNYQVSSTLAGGYRSKFRGRGMDFDEVRLYQPGDDIRNIDWRVTARTGKAHTKLFKEERERPVFILLDQSPALFFGSQVAFKSVIAARAAALLIWASINAGSRIGGVIFDEQDYLVHRPSGQRKEALSMLRKIVNRHNQVYERMQSGQIDLSDDGQSLQESLARLRRLAKPGSLIYLFSDFQRMNNDARRHLSHLCRHNELQAYLLTDKLDEQLPPAGLYSVTDGQDVGLIKTGDKSLYDRYALAHREHLEELTTLFQQNKIMFDTLPTNAEIAVVLAAASTPRIIKK